jgi:hypothetical protein
VGQATVLQRLEEEGASSPGGGKTASLSQTEWSNVRTAAARTHILAALHNHNPYMTPLSGTCLYTGSLSVLLRLWCTALSEDSRDSFTHPVGSSPGALPLQLHLRRPSSCSAHPCLTSHPHMLLSKDSRSQPEQAGAQVGGAHTQASCGAVQVCVAS